MKRQSLTPSLNRTVSNVLNISSESSSESSTEEEGYTVAVAQPESNPSAQIVKISETNGSKNIDSPKTQDSTSALDLSGDGNLQLNENLNLLNLQRSTFTSKSSGPMLRLPKNYAKIAASKNMAKFEIEKDCKNDIVYHKNDARNRHRISFKVWKNREDGALLRPKLLPKVEDKKEIHSSMLNENNKQLKSEPVVYATKELINIYEGTNGENYNIGIISILF